MSYFIYHKSHPNDELDATDIQQAFFTALGDLDKKYSNKEYILAFKSDFDIISKVLEKIANQASKDIRTKEGIRDKYSDTAVYYTIPEIEARWNISGTAVRRAISEKRLHAKEVSGKKCKYRVLKEDFESYADNNDIKLRSM